MTPRKKRPRPTPKPYRELCIVCCDCGKQGRLCRDCAESARRGDWAILDQQQEVTGDGKVVTRGRMVSRANGQVGIQFVERTLQ